MLIWPVKHIIMMYWGRPGSQPRGFKWPLYRQEQLCSSHVNNHSTASSIRQVAALLTAACFLQPPWAQSRSLKATFRILDSLSRNWGWQPPKTFGQIILILSGVSLLNTVIWKTQWPLLGQSDQESNSSIQSKRIHRRFADIWVTVNKIMAVIAPCCRSRAQVAVGSMVFPNPGSDADLFHVTRINTPLASRYNIKRPFFPFYLFFLRKIICKPVFLQGCLATSWHRILAHHWSTASQVGTAVHYLNIFNSSTHEYAKLTISLWSPNTAQPEIETSEHTD